MKKLFSSLSALIISCLMTANVFAADLKIDNINVNSDNITFSVVLSELPNEINAIHGLQIRYTYDADVLEYKSGMSTLLNKGGLEMTAKDGKGNVVWLDMNVADEATSKKVTAEMLEEANGVLFELQFKKTDSAVEETSIIIDYARITESIGGGKFNAATIDDLTITNAVIDFFAEEKAAAKVVIDLIDAIGEVTLDSLNAIETAEKAYAELTDAQRVYVINADALKASRETYTALKEAYDEDVADRGVAQVVIDLIDAIGDVTLGSLNAIEDAEKSYEHLTDIQKEYVTNYDALEKARAEYNCLKAEAYGTVIVICDKTYDNDRIKVIATKNIPAGKVVTIGGKEAAMITNSDGSANYYITIDQELDLDFNSDELGYEDIVIDEPENEEAITKLIMGDADLNGELTVEDILIILKKTAELEDVKKYYVNPFAYIVSDIIGDGHITSSDAFVNLGIIGGNPDAYKWVKPIGIK